MGGIRGETSEKTAVFLSVVMPVYNGEKDLPAAIESILNATYKDIELLLVDDGSTDQSAGICVQYQKTDKRIRYIYQENSGIVSARNRGLLEASGAYLCFCDQDDIVAPRMYERLIGRMQTCGAQIGICGTGRLINGKKSPYERIGNGVYGAEEIRRELLYPILFRGYEYDFVQSGNYLYGTLWKCIFNRSFIMENGFRFKRFIDYEDDWLFVTETLCAAKKAVTDSYTGYYWRVNNGSKSHSCHFVENIIPRIREYSAYVGNYLPAGVVDKEILKEYISVSLCEKFVILYQNEAGIPEYDKEKRKQYHMEVREYMESVDYRTKLECQKRLKRGVFRRKAVLGALRYLGVERTFCISRAVDWLERTLGSVQWVVMFERRLKRGKNEVNHSDTML